jgi:hypothetical protein
MGGPYIIPNLFAISQNLEWVKSVAVWQKKKKGIIT